MGEKEREARENKSLHSPSWDAVGASEYERGHSMYGLEQVAKESYCDVSNPNLCGCNNGCNTQRQHKANNTQIRQIAEDQQSGSFGQHRISENGGDVADSEKLFCNVSNHNGGISTQSEPFSKSGDSCGTENLADSTIKRLEGFNISKQSNCIREWPPSNAWQNSSQNDVGNAMCERQPRQGQSWFGSDPAEKGEGETDHAFSERIGHIWGIESPLGRVAHGVAARVDRLRCLGNGQVPAVVRLAWNLLR
jgi:hypothetical protein